MITPERVVEWIEQAVGAVQTIDPRAVAQAASELVAARQRGATIFVAGNGGSASTASHLALDLQKAGRPAGGHGASAVCLSDNMGLVTAWANDSSFDRVFAEQLDVLAREGDILVVISVSGSSPNLLALVEAARRLGVRTIGLLGRDGGRLRPLVHHAVVVSSHDYGWVESVHVILHHMLTYALRVPEPSASLSHATK